MHLALANHDEFYFKFQDHAQHHAFILQELFSCDKKKSRRIWMGEVASILLWLSSLANLHHGCHMAITLGATFTSLWDLNCIWAHLLLGSGLFIRNLNDMRGQYQILSPPLPAHPIYKKFKEKKQMYTYLRHARKWTCVFTLSFSVNASTTYTNHVSFNAH